MNKSAKWTSLVEKTDQRSDIVQWAYPVSEGVYLPTPFASVEMCMACETDSLMQRFPGSEYTLFPDDAWTFLAHGEDDYIVGWLQYLLYRFPNVMGWTSYTQTLAGKPYIDVSRIIRLRDSDFPRRLQQVRESNPLGVRAVIQTSSDPIDELSLKCLQTTGDLFYLTTLPIDETKFAHLVPCFKEIKVIRSGWSTPVSFAMVVVVFLGYTGKPPSSKLKKLPKEYYENIEEIWDLMISQQEYLNGFLSTKNNAFLDETSPTFIQFLTESFPEWNI